MVDGKSACSPRRKLSIRRWMLVFSRRWAKGTESARVGFWGWRGGSHKSAPFACPIMPGWGSQHPTLVLRGGVMTVGTPKKWL